MRGATPTYGSTRESSVAQATLRSLHDRVKSDMLHNNSVRMWEKHIEDLMPGDEPSTYALAKKPRDLKLWLNCFVLADGTVMGSPDALEARRLTKLVEEKTKLHDVLSKTSTKMKTLIQGE